MSPTITSRKPARQQIKAILEANVLTLAATFDHQAKQFAGLSPIAMVYSDGSEPRFPGYTDDWQYFIVQLWWLREDAQAAEDGLDDLEQEVRQVLLDHSSEEGYWHDLSMDGEKSALDYPKVDGRQYRRTTFGCRVQVITE